MKTAVKRLYEGLFLVDSGLAAQDWQKMLDEVQRVMERAGAEVVSQKKWDDRRMTYEIQGKARGTYILVYFNCDTEKVKGIERDVQLSEILMRVMILRTDKMSQQDIEKATPADSTPVTEASSKAAADSTPAPEASSEEQADSTPVPEASSEEQKNEEVAVDKADDDSSPGDGDIAEEIA
ncbi:MAG: 30S ribosomal protein S6 [Planctomycetes bacterium]|nr:30S ribosomal protein S6 [Planctomycetota bacterium]